MWFHKCLFHRTIFVQVYVFNCLIALCLLLFLKRQFNYSAIIKFVATIIGLVAMSNQNLV